MPRTQLAGLGPGIGLRTTAFGFVAAANMPGTLTLHADGSPIPIWTAETGGSVNAAGTFVTDDYGRAPGWGDAAFFGLAVDFTIPPAPPVTVILGGGGAGATGPPGPPALSKGVWAIGTTYAAGDVVTYGGYPYGSKVASNLGHQPDTSPTQWLQLLSLPATTMFTDVVNTATRRQQIAIIQTNRVNAHLAPRPGLLPSLTHWATDNATKTQVAPGAGGAPATDALGGSAKILQLACTAAGQVKFYPDSTRFTPAVPGNVFEFSAYLYQPSAAGQVAKSWRLAFAWVNAALGTISQFTTAAPGPVYAQDGWVRISATSNAAPPLTAWVQPIIYLASPGGAIGDIFYLDGNLIEPGSTLLSYGDGNYLHWTWGGTAYDSASSAVAEDSYLRGRDAGDTVDVWKISPAGYAYFVGVDAGSGKITNVADPTAVTDAVNLRTLNAVAAPLTPTLDGSNNLLDVVTVTGSKSIYALRDQREERRRNVSRGAFGHMRFTKGAALVALSSDDGHNTDYNTLWPIIGPLGIPWTFAIILHDIGASGTPDFMTWAQIQEMRDYGGCEIACHSRNHIDPTTQGGIANFIDEAITAAGDLAAGPGGAGAPQYYIDTFIQPGTWTGAYNFDTASKIDPPALVADYFQSRYSLVTAYIPQASANGVHVLPPGRMFGGHRYGFALETDTLATVQQRVRLAQAQGGLLVGSGHTDLVGTGGGLNDWATVTSILNWLAAERDAGRVEFMTLSSAYHALPDKDGPRNLMLDGDFHQDVAGTVGSGGALYGWFYVSGAPTVIAPGGQTGTLPPGSPTPGSLILNTTADVVNTGIPTEIRRLRIEFDARTKNGAASGGQQAQIKVATISNSPGGLATVTFQTGSSAGPNWPSLTSAWQHFRCLVGLDPQATYGYAVQPCLTAGGGVEFTNFKVCPF